MRKIISAGALLLALAGCGAPAMYVHADDPVLTACQNASVQNIAALRQAVDDANSTNPMGGVAGTSAQALVPDQVAGLRHAARVYVSLAATVPAHPRFADALRNEAQEFSAAAAAPSGLTTNSVATAADTFAGQITTDCGAYQVGTPGSNPGGFRISWGLLGLATGGYLLVALAASFVIAMAERARPRKKRLSPGKIFLRSLVWWVFIFTSLGAAYGQMVAAVTLTKDERRDDRIAALDRENARLEEELRKPLKGSK
jgi:hypothetical protein